VEAPESQVSLTVPEGACHDLFVIEVLCTRGAEPCAKADVACYELLALLVMKGVSEPDAETGVSLGEDPCYVIVSDKLSCMELSKYSFERRLAQLP
jgi:hypothetical protein